MNAIIVSGAQTVRLRVIARDAVLSGGAFDTAGYQFE